MTTVTKSTELQRVSLNQESYGLMEMFCIQCNYGGNEIDNLWIRNNKTLANKIFQLMQQAYPKADSYYNLRDRQAPLDADTFEEYTKQ